MDKPKIESPDPKPLTKPDCKCTHPFHSHDASEETAPCHAKTEDGTCPCEGYEPVDSEELPDPAMFDAAKMIEAAEQVKALGDRAVAIGMPGEERTVDQYVIETVGSEIARDYGLWAFCPLSPQGIQVGMTFLAELPPGFLVGMYHPGVGEDVVAWEDDYREAIISLVRAELARTKREIDSDKVVLVGENQDDEDLARSARLALKSHATAVAAWLERLETGGSIEEEPPAAAERQVEEQPDPSDGSSENGGSNA